MKKVITFLTLAIAIVTFPGYGMAHIFTLDQEDLALIWEAYEVPGGGYSSMISGRYYYPLGEGYQFYAQHANRPERTETWVEMGIGAVLEKTASWQRDTLVEIGGDNLQGYDEFSMFFSGTNGWWVNLFVQTGYPELGEPNNRYYSDWVLFESEFTPGIISKTVKLTLDLRSIPYINHVTSLGFAMGKDLDPGDVQTFVVQAYPAPSDLYLNVFDQGKYNSGYGYDSHFPTQTEAGTGQTTYIRPDNPDRVYRHFHNAFFVFDLTSVNRHITAGKVNLQLQRYDSRDLTESFTLYDVTTPIEELLAGGRHLWSTIGLDLESGKEYGSATIQETDLGSVISIELSKEALSDLNLSLGGFFAVGAHSTTSDNPEPGLYDIDFIGFGEQGDGIQQLELSIVKTIQDILDFYDYAVDKGTLIGVGKGKSAENKINELRDKIEAVQDYLTVGDIEAACDQLFTCYEKCDGQPKPKDFVAGEGAEELASIIDNFMMNLSCE